MSVTDAIDTLVALTGSDLSHVNTVAPFELRPIVFAQGKQFRNGDEALTYRIPDFLAQSPAERLQAVPELPRSARTLSSLPPVPLEIGADGVARFFNAKQGVLFTITVVNTKSEYVTALTTPGVHLIYSGHARFGRGPCFGAGGGSPGEEWEEGHGGHPNDDGIFRLGFPFIGVPVGDILDHGYTADLVTADVSMAAADCEPDLRGSRGALTPHTIDEIAAIAVKTAELKEIPELAALSRDDVSLRLMGQVRDADPATRYWTYRGAGNISVALHAGWIDTRSTPDEIGTTVPQCRVFSHFGCATFIHNYPVVRKIMGWKREGNERYAYWNTDIAHTWGAVYWLYHVLMYDQFNANQPWERSLKYAVQKTNAALARDGERYRVI